MMQATHCFTLLHKTVFRGLRFCHATWIDSVDKFCHSIVLSINFSPSPQIFQFKFSLLNFQNYFFHFFLSINCSHFLLAVGDSTSHSLFAKQIVCLIHCPPVSAAVVAAVPLPFAHCCCTIAVVRHQICCWSHPNFDCDRC